MALRWRLPLVEGDRLRLDSNAALEKKAFTLKGMTIKGRGLSKARPGSLVLVPRAAGASRGDRVFKTGSKTDKKGSAATWPSGRSESNKNKNEASLKKDTSKEATETKVDTSSSDSED